MILIRRATIEDASRISYLIQKSTERVLENNYTGEQIRAWRKANTPKAVRENMASRMVFCAIEKGRLIGTISLQGKEILGLYVSFALRGKGIGKKLLFHLEDYAEKKNIIELGLSSTPSALNFYIRYGYMSIGPVSTIIDGVAFHETRMTKKLLPEK